MKKIEVVKERLIFLYSRLVSLATSFYFWITPKIKSRLKSLHNLLRTSNFYRYKKLFLLLVALFFFLVVSAGFIPFTFKSFNGIVENILKEAGADSVSVEKVSVSVLGGTVRVENVYVYKRRNAREHYVVEVSRVDIRGNVIRLGLKILGQKNNEEQPSRDIFMEIYDKPVELIGEAFVALAELGLINEKRLQNASVRFTERGKAGVSAEGVSANLQRKRRSFSGSAEVAKASMPNIAEVQNINIKLRSDGNKLEFFDVSGEVFGGNFSAQASLSLDDFSVLGGNARGERIDVGQFWQNSVFSGNVSGRAGFEVEIAHSKAAKFEAVNLSGNFWANRVVASRLPLQRVHLVRRFSLDICPMRFERVAGEFTFSDGRFNFSEMTGTGGDIMNFRSVGWFRLDGRLYKNFNGEFSREFIPTLTRLVRNSLEMSETGGLFYCAISGNIENPQIRMGRSVVRRGARNVFRR
ncbi:MAG: hypothetical protein FWE23_02280 [Chitinivibrionia bacterium]|nr:hypothetical protein [Chitinivibrionia bacterium]